MLNCFSFSEKMSNPPSRPSSPLGLIDLSLDTIRDNGYEEEDEVSLLTSDLTFQNPINPATNSRQSQCGIYTETERRLLVDNPPSESQNVDYQPNQRPPCNLDSSYAIFQPKREISEDLRRDNVLDNWTPVRYGPLARDMDMSLFDNDSVSSIVDEDVSNTTGMRECLDSVTMATELTEPGIHSELSERNSVLSKREYTNDMSSIPDDVCIDVSDECIPDDCDNTMYERDEHWDTVNADVDIPVSQTAEPTSVRAEYPPGDVRDQPSRSAFHGTSVENSSQYGGYAEPPSQNLPSSQGLHGGYSQARPAQYNTISTPAWQSSNTFTSHQAVQYPHSPWPPQDSVYMSQGHRPGHVSTQYHRSVSVVSQVNMLSVTPYGYSSMCSVSCETLQHQPVPTNPRQYRQEDPNSYRYADATDVTEEAPAPSDGEQQGDVGSCDNTRQPTCHTTDEPGGMGGCLDTVTMATELTVPETTKNDSVLSKMEYTNDMDNTHSDIESLEDKCICDKTIDNFSDDNDYNNNQQDRVLTNDTQDRVLTNDTQDRVLTNDTQDRVLTNDTQDRVLTNDTQDRVLTNDTQDRVLTNDTQDRVLTNDTQDRVLTNDTQRESVASDKTLPSIKVSNLDESEAANDNFEKRDVITLKGDSDVIVNMDGTEIAQYVDVYSDFIDENGDGSTKPADVITAPDDVCIDISDECIPDDCDNTMYERDEHWDTVNVDVDIPVSQTAEPTSVRAEYPPGDVRDQPSRSAFHGTSVENSSQYGGYAEPPSQNLPSSQGLHGEYSQARPAQYNTISTPAWQSSNTFTSHQAVQYPHSPWPPQDSVYMSQDHRPGHVSTQYHRPVSVVSQVNMLSVTPYGYSSMCSVSCETLQHQPVQTNPRQYRQEDPNSYRYADATDVTEEAPAPSDGEQQGDVGSCDNTRQPTCHTTDEPGLSGSPEIATPETAHPVSTVSPEESERPLPIAPTANAVNSSDSGVLSLDSSGEDCVITAVESVCDKTHNNLNGRQQPVKCRNVFDDFHLILKEKISDDNIAHAEGKKNGDLDRKDSQRGMSVTNMPNVKMTDQKECSTEPTQVASEIAPRSVSTRSNSLSGISHDGIRHDNKQAETIDRVSDRKCGLAPMKRPRGRPKGSTNGQPKERLGPKHKGRKEYKDTGRLRGSPRKKLAVDDVTQVVDDVTEAVDEVKETVDVVTEAVDDVTLAVDDVTQAVDDVTQAVDDASSGSERKKSKTRKRSKSSRDTADETPSKKTPRSKSYRSPHVSVKKRRGRSGDVKECQTQVAHGTEESPQSHQPGSTIYLTYEQFLKHRSSEITSVEEDADEGFENISYANSSCFRLHYSCVRYQMHSSVNADLLFRNGMLSHIERAFVVFKQYVRVLIQ